MSLLRELNPIDFKLQPDFEPTRFIYEASTNLSATSVFVSATPESPLARLEPYDVNGEEREPLFTTPLPLDVGKNLLTVIVTAEAVNSKSPYQITITRQSMCSWTQRRAAPYFLRCARTTIYDTARW